LSLEHKAVKAVVLKNIIKNIHHMCTRRTVPSDIIGLSRTSHKYREVASGRGGGVGGGEGSGGLGGAMKADSGRASTAAATADLAELSARGMRADAASSLSAAITSCSVSAPSVLARESSLLA
jgi:hypothetical protein